MEDIRPFAKSTQSTKTVWRRMHKKSSNIATIRNISEFRFEGWGLSKTIYAILPDESNGAYHYLKISTKRPWFLRINNSYIRVGILKEYVF
jgi:hypothetical protein